MRTVGAYEAKTHLSQLLERVAKGERIVITKHGVPVAILEPIGSAHQEDPHTVIQKLREFRKGLRLGDGSLREMIEEGRR